MNLLDFYRQYPDEASCEAALRSFREHHGLFCLRLPLLLTIRWNSFWMRQMRPYWSGMTSRMPTC